MSINNVTLSGRLTRDPELKQAGSYVFAEMSLAIDHYNKDKAKATTSYVDIKVWGDKKAPAICKYLRKGKFVCVSGELKQERWDSKDGKKMSKITITARDIEWEFDKTIEEKPAPSPAAQENFGDVEDLF